MNIPCEQVDAQVNRSMPASVVIPVLAYPDVRSAVCWLSSAFGFTERLRIGSHRAQLSFGEGDVVVVKRVNLVNGGAGSTHSIMVRVADVDRHYEHARQAGARIVSPPTDYPYGERQYMVDDPGGHRWTFSQTTADVDPGEWGGALVA